MKTIWRWIKQNIVLFKFYILLGYFILLFFLFLHWDISYKYIADVFPQHIASMTGLILNLIGIKTVVDGKNVILQSGFSFSLVYHCAGLFGMGIYAAAVIAFPAKLKEKLIGLLIGLPALHIINILRVVGLGVVGNIYPNLFEYFHLYLWQGIFIVFVIAMWLIWRFKFVKGEMDTAVSS